MKANMRCKLFPVGWKSKVAKKRASYSVTISKAVILGSDLDKGKELYCYLGEEGNRSIIIIYLDGKKK